jgi:hypothetical protein
VYSSGFKCMVRDFKCIVQVLSVWLGILRVQFGF